jgi:hypothetical protein
MVWSDLALEVVTFYIRCAWIARGRSVYLFYFDESGSRDPSIGTPQAPKDHIYVLLAVGIYERKWRPFDRAISNVKLELADYLRREGKGQFDLADCEVKSNWIRNAKEREQKSPFLWSLDAKDIERLVGTYFRQLEATNATIMAAVIDKRHLQPRYARDVAQEGLRARLGTYRQFHARLPPQAPSPHRDGRHEQAAKPRRRHEARLLSTKGQPEL